MFKKVLSLYIVIMMLVSVFNFNVLAEDNIKVVLNGKQLQFDVQPQVISDRTFVPMRAIFEALGAIITWDKKDYSVTGIKGNTTIKLKINDNIALVNNREVSLDASPKVINGRTLIPLRFVGEALGALIDWDESSKSVLIAYNVGSQMDSKFCELKKPYESKSGMTITVISINKTELSGAFEYSVKYTQKKRYKRSESRWRDI